MIVEIPRLENMGDDDEGPGWYRVVGSDGKPHKPIIRCKCGRLTGIGGHTVHADGTVTASFYHKRGNVYPEDPEGCEWHEYIRLLDYNCGHFEPDK